VKKSLYLSLSTFQNWISQKSMQKSQFLKDLSKIKEFLENSIEKQTLPKVALDRKSNQSDFFYFGQISFKPGNGLFCLLDIPSKDEVLYTQLKAALNLLQHTGLGGKRTWGLGQFSYSWENLSLDIPSSPVAWTTLGTLIPSQNDQTWLSANKNNTWNFEERIRWTNSIGQRTPVRLPPVVFIKEGAYLSQCPEGQFIDYNPENFEYVLYGLGFPIPIALSQESNYIW
jgi:CRISPR-associated protein Csm4